MSENNNLTIHHGKIDANPREVGYDETRLEILDRHFMKIIESNKIQCASYLLSKDGQVFACRSMGKLRYDDTREFMPDSIRRIASITKVVTSICVMQLVEKGLIYLNQPVSSIIPEFDTVQHKKITVFHLLTHTSGLSADPGYFTEPYPRNWWNTESEDSWIKQFLTGPLLCQPGEQWNYSSMGFAILGEIVTRVSGVVYEQYAMENVIKPLGMNRSFFDVPEELHEEMCCINKFEVERLNKKYEGTNMPSRAGGGLFSTLEDLKRLGQMLLNKGTYNGNILLGRKTVEAMTSKQLGAGVPAFMWGAQLKSFNYGIGMHIERDTLLSPGSFSHEGAGRSALYMDPVENFLAAYFVPSNESWAPESIISPRSIIWSGIL